MRLHVEVRCHIAVLALIAATAVSAPVQAADMAPPPVLRGPLPVTEQGQDWSGFYVGGFGGFNQMEFEPRNAASGLIREMLRPNNVLITLGRADDVTLQKRTTSNAIGYGLYMGYNWMMDDYVVGLEADYTRAKLNGTAAAGRNASFNDPSAAAIPNNAYGYSVTASSAIKVTEYGTIRGRMGVPFGSFMPYVTAGAAWGRLSYGNSATLTGTVATGVPNGTGTATVYGPPVAFAPYSLKDGARTRFAFGYALGTGIDWALTQNIVLRAEVMHVRFGNAGDTTAAVNTARAGAAVKF
jgi:outer membrane immunogenic protein